MEKEMAKHEEHNYSKTVANLKPLMCFTNISSIFLFTPVVAIFPEISKYSFVEKQQRTTCLKLNEKQEY